MKNLKQIRQKIINNLLAQYRANSTQLQCIELALVKKGIHPLYFDHFAMIDLPGPHTGIPYLIQLFEALGFIVQGQGYLPEKQNDFVWLTEIDNASHPAQDVLPQVVVADFRLNELPIEIAEIIKKYAHYASPLPLLKLKEWIKQIHSARDNETLAIHIIEVVCHYLKGRDWPLPTLNEFLQVWEFNQLLAWVLVYGRMPNHFTLSIHLLNYFSDLTHFHTFIQQEVSLALNTVGGLIKGNESIGLAQSSTIGGIETLQLANGSIALPTGFVEFVWRYPRKQGLKPHLWNDYFNGFLANQATHVIQSLSTTA